MRPTSSGKIFLADERGLTQTAQLQRYSTFSFACYSHPHKQPFGSLLALNEEHLTGGQATALPVPVASYVLVLPVVGAVRVGPAPGQLALAEVEQAHLLAIPGGGTLHLQNPYATDTISFLHLWLTAPAGTPASCLVSSFRFVDLAGQLVPIVPGGGAPGGPPRVSLGCFGGRQETEYVLADAGSCFVYVLAGAFEVEGRLLHAHDGLALWDTATVELEALSPDALLLLLELAP
jgi:quercetin 2,3-dioxygenase